MRGRRSPRQKEEGTPKEIRKSKRQIQWLHFHWEMKFPLKVVWVTKVEQFSQGVFFKAYCGIVLWRTGLFNACRTVFCCFFFKWKGRQNFQIYHFLRKFLILWIPTRHLCQNNLTNTLQSHSDACECALSQTEGEKWQSNWLYVFLNSKFTNSFKGRYTGWVEGLCILIVPRFLTIHSTAPFLTLGWPLSWYAWRWGGFPGHGTYSLKNGKVSDKLRNLPAKFPHPTSHSTPTPCRVLITPWWLVHTSTMAFTTQLTICRSGVSSKDSSCSVNG